VAQHVVPLYDPGWSLRQIGSQHRLAVDAVLRGDAPASQLVAFEAAFARVAGAGHAVATSSGTAALKIALLSLGIGPGDEVIIPAYTAMGTAAAVLHTGARLVLADIDPATLTITPEAAELKIGSRTRALIPVHLFGHPAPMPELADLALRYGLVMVEDACLALGARIGDQLVGRWGQVTCFSFAPTKHLGAISSGGAAATDDAALAERMRLLAGSGRTRGPAAGSRIRDPQVFQEVGLNETLSEVEAVVLLAKLPFLRTWEQQRRGHASAYREAFEMQPFECPAESPPVHHTYRNFVIRTGQRRALLRGLGNAGIEAGVPYYPPLYRQPALVALGCRPESFPGAEDAAARVLSLPVGPELSADERGRVIAAVGQTVALP